MHQMLILDLPGWLTLAARAQVSVGFPARKTMSESIAKVVFIRHGESQGNAKNVYTGWDDTPLSIKGDQEAEEAGLCLKAKGLKFDICFTSALQLLGKSGKSKLKGLSLTHTQFDMLFFNFVLIVGLASPTFPLTAPLLKGQRGIFSLPMDSTWGPHSKFRERRYNYIILYQIL
jgi:bisphosphoglycerate-dependent phosphoglycerate mutase